MTTCLPPIILLYTREIRTAFQIQTTKKDIASSLASPEACSRSLRFEMGLLNSYFQSMKVCESVFLLGSFPPRSKEASAYCVVTLSVNRQSMAQKNNNNNDGAIN